MNFIYDSNAEIIELQRQYREGKIKEEDLSNEQIIELSALYDKQISELRLSNEYRKKKLLKYREKMKKVSA
jgi:hypothetical protein